jgi:hypothetical protein
MRFLRAKLKQTITGFSPFFFSIAESLQSTTTQKHRSKHNTIDLDKPKAYVLKYAYQVVFLLVAMYLTRILLVP